MLIKSAKDIKGSEITDESAYLNRRQLLAHLVKAGVVATGLMAGSSQADLLDRLFGDKDEDSKLKSLSFKKNTQFDTTESLTDEQLATSYNNFYEFSLDKEEPKELAKNFKTKPWTLEVAGEAELTGKFNLEDILSNNTIEERIYRMRCVEAWSMVIPWLGMPMGELLKKFKPTSKAKFVKFTTLEDPKQFPGQRRGGFSFSSLDWPYVEGLRIDEAMHPLTLMVVGMYGKELPGQNGAPLRLIVPWKYGFKGIKSIVKITFTEKPFMNSWHKAAPNEYGFFANVNPDVSHPRWSQAKERRLTTSSLTGIQRIETLPFNGYAKEVASLYSGMDLRRFY